MAFKACSVLLGDPLSLGSFKYHVSVFGADGFGKWPPHECSKALHCS